MLFVCVPQPPPPPRAPPSQPGAGRVRALPADVIAADLVDRANPGISRQRPATIVTTVGAVAVDFRLVGAAEFLLSSAVIEKSHRSKVKTNYPGTTTPFLLFLLWLIIHYPLSRCSLTADAKLSSLGYHHAGYNLTVVDNPRKYDNS